MSPVNSKCRATVLTVCLALTTACVTTPGNLVEEWLAIDSLGAVYFLSLPGSKSNVVAVLSVYAKNVSDSGLEKSINFGVSGGSLKRPPYRLTFECPKPNACFLEGKGSSRQIRGRLRLMGGPTVNLVFHRSNALEFLNKTRWARAPRAPRLSQRSFLPQPRLSDLK